MQSQQPVKVTNGVVSVRSLHAADLQAADHIMRVAFGTFLGMPQPAEFLGDAAYVRHRWQADPTAAFAADFDGQIVGSNFATNWGSVGFFGPLTVHPDLWGRGIAKRLIEPVLDRFASWNVRHAGLFTFAHSEKHVGLYQSFGFWPRFLTAIMAKPVATEPTNAESATTEPATPHPAVTPASLFSELPEAQRVSCLGDCRELTDSLYEGLDLGLEISAVANLHMGDTALLWDGSQLAGLAVCHFGSGTEAGSGTGYVKFAAVRPGQNGDALFHRLLDACEALARANGAASLVAGVNMGRHEVYRLVLARGFRTQIQGVAMHKDNDSGYNRPGIYLIDDWR